MSGPPGGGGVLYVLFSELLCVSVAIDAQQSAPEPSERPTFVLSPLRLELIWITSGPTSNFLLVVMDLLGYKVVRIDPSYSSLGQLKVLLVVVTSVLGVCLGTCDGRQEQRNPVCSDASIR